MTKPCYSLVTAILAFLPAITVANSPIEGCYFAQTRIPGEWATSTTALFIESTATGVLVYGSLTGLHNAWISTPENEQPIALKKLGESYVYQGKLNLDKPHARCELVLHYDQQAIYINKYDEGCTQPWYTGDGIGPSEMKFADRRANPDICRSHLGIVEESDNE